MYAIFDYNAFVQGFWGGLFQLVALGLAAAFATFIYQARKARLDLRDELIDSINQFAIRLYKPRKLYQATIDGTCDPLARIADPTQRETRRLETIQHALEEVIAATGEFRVLQVKLIPLYGHDPEIFGYYMAIWRYLKEIRDRMGRGDTLYFHAENPESPDAFYLLIDAFRYRVILRPFVSSPPGLAKPTADVLAALRQKGNEVYAEYFPRPASPSPGP